ncbi:MAG: type VII toxin-antitoxin system MntA family adenylyltransferase antitoxin [Eubacteriales bacterium]
MDIELMSEKLMPVFQKYGVTCCYLFGSRAGQDFYPDSDIDLAVIFDDFSNSKHIMALEIEMHDAAADVLKPLEVDLLFLQKAPVYLKFDVIKNGKVIYSRDEDFRTDFEDITIRDYLDFKPVLDMYYREMAEAILVKNQGDFS